MSILKYYFTILLLFILFYTNNTLSQTRIPENEQNYITSKLAEIEQLKGEDKENEVITALIFVADIYLKYDDLNSAEKKLISAKNHAKKSSKTKYRLLFINFKLGVLYQNMRLYDKSLLVFEENLELNRKKNDAMSMNKALLNVVQAAELVKKYKRAIECLHEAEKIAQYELYDENLVYKIYASLAENYRRTGNSDKYSEYNELLQKKSLYDKENQINRAKKEKKNTENKLQKTTEELNLASDSIFSLAELKKMQEAKIELDSLKIKQQNVKLDASQKFNQLLSVLIFIGFVFLSIVIVFWRKNKRKNKKLNAQKEEILIQSEHIKTINQKIMGSINYASRLQNALLPDLTCFHKHLPDSFVWLKPRDIVSGDFYWITIIKEKVVVAAVDCTGHGVPGAFMSIIGNLYLNQIVNSQKIIKADEILNELQNYIQASLNQHTTKMHDGMDMSLCVIDKKEKIIELSGAKNPLVYIQNNDLKLVKADNMAIGGFRRNINRKFTNTSISYAENEITLYLFSDGYQDQFSGRKGRKFMRKRLKKLFFQIHKKTIHEQEEILKKELFQWMGGNSEQKTQQLDDILIIGIKLK